MLYKYASLWDKGGGSDEKIRKMWLGREIVVVGLPPFMKLGRARDTPRLVSPCRDDTFISLESKSNLAPTTNTVHPTLYIYMHNTFILYHRHN